jgi:hypothetical protein
MTTESISLLLAIRKTGRTDLMEEFSRMMTEYLFSEEKDEQINYVLMKMLMEPHQETTQQMMSLVKRAESFGSLLKEVKNTPLRLLFEITSSDSLEPDAPWRAKFSESSTTSPGDKIFSGDSSASDTPKYFNLCTKLPKPAKGEKSPKSEPESESHMGKINGQCFSNFEEGSKIIDNIPNDQTVYIALNKWGISKTFRNRDNAKGFLRIQTDERMPESNVEDPNDQTSDYTMININGKSYISIEEVMSSTFRIPGPFCVTIGNGDARKISKEELEGYLRRRVGSRKILGYREFLKLYSNNEKFYNRL